MDAVKAMQHYVNKMVTDVAGMKILLLDADTTTFVSVVLTQSQLLAKEVFLIDRIDKRQRDKMKHLKCVCFVRPTPESIQALVDELRDPAYGQYHLFFSNIIKKSQIERLAEVDEFEVVKEVQEYYGDYLALNADFFTLNMTLPSWPIFGDSPHIWDGRAFQRCVEGLLSILLSLKKRPLVRYEKNSTVAKRLAAEVHYQMQQEASLFDFRRPDTPPILLILDRRNDPVTPLLNQWTYQAMVHELLGIQNGRVDMSRVPDVRAELKEIVLSADQDPFFKKNMYLNLGDLGTNIKSYVDEYQSKTKSNMKIESIAEMKRFVEEYPEFRKLSGNVSKHVALVSELSKTVERDGLLEAGELEQSLACFEQHASDLRTLQEIIQKPNIPLQTKVRLVILYALRYEKSPQNSLSSLQGLLRQAGAAERDLNTIQAVLRYGGTEQRQDDIFSNESILSKSKTIFRGLKGAENVYEQHVNHLLQTLEAMSKGRLKDLLYPFVDGGSKDRPQDVIVFIIGGATYAEARSVAQLNASNTQGFRVILGGTCVHNSSSFLREVFESSLKWTGK